MEAVCYLYRNLVSENYYPTETSSIENDIADTIFENQECQPSGDIP